MVKSCEQRAREILDRMGVDGALEMRPSEVVEIANLIAENVRLTAILRQHGLSKSSPMHCPSASQD